MNAASLEQWPRLSQLLDELLDLDPVAVSARLVDLRARDAPLADALQGLLGRVTAVEREGFLQQPPQLADQALQGQTIGAYQVERKLGQGGMGTVWLARRSDGRFEGRVAIKLLAAGVTTRVGAARFTREGSLLARLAHPHIARLLDAGLAGSQPYLVLEHVDGVPIDVYCGQHSLDSTARVRLCLDVLDAVAHAHTRLILHRDIKPGNILVTAQGELKLLDFGIAKLLDDQTGTGQATELTREAGNAFTLLYAAPEQAQGGEVTTATDVYALGVLLHLLLTGLYPNGVGETPMERMRRLVEVEPPSMSVALASQPGADPAALRRARGLRGDLDTIVAKALKKRPAERYANAEQLASDLRRWLQDDPILARPDAALYRARKFVARYRTGVALGALAFAALTVGIGLALWQAGAARSQQAKAEGLIEFMLGDLRTKLRPVGRLDVLDAVGEKALAHYASQDGMRLDADALGRRARALHLIGEIADTRGKLDDAQRRFTEAQESTASLLERAPDDEQRLFDHAQSMFWVGMMAWRQGRLGEAEAQFGRYVALATRLLDRNAAKPEWQAELAYAQQNLGIVQRDQGRLVEARSLLLRAQGRLRSLVPVKPELAAELGNNFAWTARIDERLGRLGAAIDGLHDQRRLLQSHPGFEKDRSAQAEWAQATAEVSRLALMQGRPADARDLATSAQATMLSLTLADPSNAQWQQSLASTHVRLAEAHAAGPGGGGPARAEAARAEVLARALVARDPTVSRWRVNLLGAALIVRAETAAPQDRAPAHGALRVWLAAEGSSPSNDTGRHLVARAAWRMAEQLQAEHLHAEGLIPEARPYLQLAAHQVEDDPAHPDLMTVAYAARAAARLGDLPRARRLAALLASTEFQHPLHLQDLQSLAAPEAGVVPAIQRRRP